MPDGALHGSAGLAELICCGLHIPRFIQGEKGREPLLADIKRENRIMAGHLLATGECPVAYLRLGKPGLSFTNTLDKCMTPRGWEHTPGRAVEQPGGQLLFQFLERLGQRGLRAIDAIGGAGDAAVIGNGASSLQVPEAEGMQAVRGCPMAFHVKLPYRVVLGTVVEYSWGLQPGNCSSSPGLLNKYFYNILKLLIIIYITLKTVFTD